LTPPPENVNIFITQGRKHFDFYLLVVAGNSFPVRRISVPHLIGDAFSIEWQPKLFFYFSEHLHWRNKELKSIQFQNYDQSFELIMTCEKQMPRLAGSIIFGGRSLFLARMAGSRWSDRGSRLHFIDNVNDHRVGKIGNNVAERVCQYHFRCGLLP
jgi:hypothetical protein